MKSILEWVSQSYRWRVVLGEGKYFQQEVLVGLDVWD